MMSKGESGQILFKGPTQQAEVKKSNVQYQDEWRASLTNQGTLGSDAVRSFIEDGKVIAASPIT